jgi:hypothetical protein
MINNLINKVDASDIREFESKLESPSTVVEELLLSQERQLAHFVSDQETSNVSGLLEFMQDHEAEGPEKVGSATQNGEVSPTLMVDCNKEFVIEESFSPKKKKKTKHSFSVIKKSIKAKKAGPKSNESDSSTSVPELGSTSKKDTTKKVVNAKKEVIKRPRAKRRKMRSRAKRRKKRRHLSI